MIELKNDISVQDYQKDLGRDIYSDKVKEAATYARNKHIGQVRRYTLESYYSHCSNVALIVSEFNISDDVLCAAFLHDVIEDTDANIKDIKIGFGEKVAYIVDELTNKIPMEAGNRKKRKTLELARLEKCSPEAQTIKMADIIDNVSCSGMIIDYGFSKIYIPELYDKVERLKNANSEIRDLAKWHVRNAIRLLDQS